MPKTTSILIVDDHAMVRGMLTKLLDQQPDMEVVGSAPNADAALTDAIKHKPDIILMDIDMPGMLCFQAASIIRSRCPDVRIVFLSAFSNDRYIEQAIAVPAWGYITKSEPEQTLVEAVRKVANGVTYFSPEIQARLVFDTDGVRLAHEARSRVSTLTEREIMVLRYIARGLSKKEIAQIMHISQNTVIRHTASVMNKLDIHDRVELARYAIREGLAEA